MYVYPSAWYFRWALKKFDAALEIVCNNLIHEVALSLVPLWQDGCQPMKRLPIDGQDFCECIYFSGLPIRSRTTFAKVSS